LGHCAGVHYAVVHQSFIHCEVVLAPEHHVLSTQSFHPFCFILVSCYYKLVSCSLSF
jgi:hypothetical protein